MSRQHKNFNAYGMLALAIICSAGLLFYNRMSSPRVLSDTDEYSGFSESVEAQPKISAEDEEPVGFGNSATPTPTTTPIATPTAEPDSPIGYFDRPFDALNSLYKSVTPVASEELEITAEDETTLKKVLILTEARYQKTLETVGETIEANKDSFTPDKLQEVLGQYNQLKTSLEAFDTSIKTLDAGTDLNSTITGIKSTSESLKRDTENLINSLVDKE